MKTTLSMSAPKIIGSPREVTGQRKNGELFQVQLGVGELQLRGASNYVAALIDLTDRQILEGKLRQAQKMEAVGQFVGGIAHDFNNLLGIIIGNLDLMLRHIVPDSRSARHAAKALTAAGRGADLTRKLLNFSLVAPSDLTGVDVNETVSNLAELLQKAMTHQYEVKLNLRQELPLALTDRGELEDALTNLCINAKDAMPAGGHIQLETELLNVDETNASTFGSLKPGSYIEISVSDTGTGISKELQSKIFDPFFSTKDVGKGTGLGLSMVFGFAKRCGGLVSIYSKEGIGTTFNIYLPAQETIEASKQTPNSEAVEHEITQGEGTVLLVDDEPDLLDLGEDILEAAGYRVLRANDAHEALDDLKTNSSEINLVISDVIMPGEMSGHDLVDKIHQSYPNIKTCLASGFMGQMSSLDRQGSSTPVLRKPYTRTQLEKFVLSVITDG